TDQARKLTSIFGKRAGTAGSAADRCVKGTSYGLGGQEAPQADGQEEAPQTAAQDPRPASPSRQVARGAVDGVPRGRMRWCICRGPGPHRAVGALAARRPGVLLTA